MADTDKTVQCPCCGRTPRNTGQAWADILNEPLAASADELDERKLLLDLDAWLRDADDRSHLETSKWAINWWNRRVVSPTASPSPDFEAVAMKQAVTIQAIAWERDAYREALEWCVKTFSSKADGMGEVAVIEKSEAVIAQYATIQENK